MDGKADVAEWFFGIGRSTNGHAHHRGHTAASAAVRPLDLKLDRSCGSAPAVAEDLVELTFFQADRSTCVE